MMENIFSEKFDEFPEFIACAPGRINLIGEHTDYNEGFVLPAAIGRNVCVAISKREDEIVQLFAVEYNEFFSIELSHLKPLKNHWANYVLGVVDQLIKSGFVFKGFNMAINGDVPIGAGMSSSAAVECASIMALNSLFKLDLSKQEMVLVAQAAEHYFAGVKCGIMDQYTSMFGKKNHLIKLDCRGNKHEYIPFSLDGYSILLFDTNVKHSLASSEYNLRKEQCEQGVEKIRKFQPSIFSLRDVTEAMISQYINDVVIRKRCVYVVKENARVHAACKSLLSGDIKNFGKKMFQTHEGLSNEYEVSCPELDFLVNIVRSEPGVVGARMMGGGFGGCTINIVKKEITDELTENIKKQYYVQMGKQMNSYEVSIEDGASSIPV